MSSEGQKKLWRYLRNWRAGMSMKIIGLFVGLHADGIRLIEVVAFCRETGIAHGIDGGETV